jgi:hypothetical protein
VRFYWSILKLRPSAIVDVADINMGAGTASFKSGAEGISVTDAIEKSTTGVVVTDTSLGMLTMYVGIGVATKSVFAPPPMIVVVVDVSDPIVVGESMVCMDDLIPTMNSNLSMRSCWLQLIICKSCIICKLMWSARSTTIDVAILSFVALNSCSHRSW